METKAYEYTTFPRRFERYKWFRPLLIALLTAVFTLIAQLILTLIGMLWIGGGMEQAREAMDRSSQYFFVGPGALMGIGGVAAMLPALALATRIVRDRPYSSYSSSRGGWNWRIFLRSLFLALIIYGGGITVESFLFPDAAADGVIKFNTIGFLLCTVLVPFQAAAEEYIFRGLLMQTFGSWTKLPVVALLVSSIVFSVSHTYGVIGLIAVFCSGLTFAVVTHYTKGLEASSASHIVNNLMVFYFTGFGVYSSQESGIGSLAVIIIIGIIYVAAIILLDRKFGWFGRAYEKSSKTKAKGE